MRRTRRGETERSLSESGIDAFSMFSIELELISGVANPKWGIKRSLSESGIDAFSMISIELKLISGVANPKGGNRTLSIRIRDRCIVHDLDCIGAYLWHGEPEGGKPNVLYQNPGTIHLRFRTSEF